MPSTKFQISDQTQTLASYLRSDKLFAAKNIDDTKLRKLLIGLAVEIGRAEGLVQEISDDYDLNQTEKLLSEWEGAVGIPNECFKIDSSDEQRRRNILTKLTALGVSTKAGFEALAATFGYTITVTAGADYYGFPFTFPFSFGLGSNKWVMVVEMDASLQPPGFPYTFPITFDDDGTLTNVIICLINKLAPSFVKVIYVYT